MTDEELKKDQLITLNNNLHNLISDLKYINARYYWGDGEYCDALNALKKAWSIIDLEIDKDNLE